MADDGSAQTQATWPLPKFYFQVKWDDTEAAFQEVSGLDMEAEPIEYRHGKTQVFSKTTMPGMDMSGTVTLKKGVFFKDNAVWDWFADIKLNTINRKQVTISLLDEGGNVTMAWTLQNAFPMKVTGTDLQSQASEVAIETLEFAHEGLVIESA